MLEGSDIDQRIINQRETGTIVVDSTIWQIEGAETGAGSAAVPDCRSGYGEMMDDSYTKSRKANLWIYRLDDLEAMVDKTGKHMFFGSEVGGQEGGFINMNQKYPFKKQFVGIKNRGMTEHSVLKMVFSDGGRK